MKKRYLVVLLLSLIFILLVPLSGFAADTGTGSSMKLSNNELLLYPDDFSKKITLQGTYDFKIIKDIEAYSDNADVATVYWSSYDNYGTIYPDNKGTANITVKVYENYKDDQDKVTTLKCKVVVGKKPKFEYSSCKGSPDEARQILLVKNAPKSIKPVWSSSNKKVAAVDSYGVVTPKGVGTCKIYARYAQKKISCKYVVRWYPNYKANITKIDKKKGIIKIRVKNRGKKSIKLIGKNAGFWYRNNKKYLPFKAKNVTIKPGKTKVITYKITDKKLKGSMKGAYLYLPIKIAGKTYKAWMWTKGTGSRYLINGYYWISDYRKRY